MEDLLKLILPLCERGIIFGILTLGVYIASRYVNFDNLAVEGAFGLGGSICALLLLHNYQPWTTLLVATIAGAVSGVLTSILHTKLKLNSLISGIIVTTALFSVVLKLSGSNLSLAGKSTIFNSLNFGVITNILVLLPFSLLIFLIMNWFLKTEIGLLLQSVGDAPQMLTNIGKNPILYQELGIALSNSLAALSGALFVQYSGYFSIWSSVGILIIGLASMIISESFQKEFGISLIIGAILYQSILAITFELQIDQDWNKLITAILIVVLIATKQLMHKERVKC